MSKIVTEREYKKYGNDLPALVRTSNGYQAWQTQHEGDRWQVFVHRLVAVAEFGYDNVRDMQVHHKNGFRWDNRPRNLKMLTPKEHWKEHGGVEKSAKGGETYLYTESELIDYLVKWYKKHGDMPTARDFRSDDDVPPPKTYEHRLGSWSASKEMAKERLEKHE